MTELIFDKSVKGSNSFCLPASDIPSKCNIPSDMLRENSPVIPDVAEVSAIRHYTKLSHMAYGVDDGAYPLGSCTMKYNPKVNEWAARLSGFSDIHPFQDVSTVQGAMELMYDLEGMLSEIGGMSAFSLQPCAGAQGESAGIAVINAYHRKNGDVKRTKILVPDSAHGTNPATANVAGYEVVEVKSLPSGLVDTDDLKSKMDDTVAGLMLTNPNTVGLFERDIHLISQIVHDGGGLVYYDGANLNAIMGVARPGDMGFDVVHYNLHKTFSTPHGGGGPGSGPVGVKKFLQEFLPVPRIVKKDGQYDWNYDCPDSIGKFHTFYGNFSVLVKAYAYILALGAEGIKESAQIAVLNANYLKKKLSKFYDVAFDHTCMHEFIVVPKSEYIQNGISTMDIAKRLLDYGYHPPTVYFPLIVKEAMMFEPTETESIESLDALAQAMENIAKECIENSDIVKQAPVNTVIGRVNEVQAARNPILNV